MQVSPGTIWPAPPRQARADLDEAQGRFERASDPSERTPGAADVLDGPTQSLHAVTVSRASWSDRFVLRPLLPLLLVGVTVGRSSQKTAHANTHAPARLMRPCRIPGSLLEKQRRQRKRRG